MVQFCSPLINCSGALGCIGTNGLPVLRVIHLAVVGHVNLLNNNSLDEGKPKVAGSIPPWQEIFLIACMVWIQVSFSVGGIRSH